MGETSKNRLAALADYIPGGAFICLNDSDMTFLTVGKSFLEFCGYTREAIARKHKNSFLDMIVPEDRRQVMEAVGREVLDGGVIETQFRMKRDNGSVLWVQGKLRTEISEDENGRGICYVILNDITKQRKEREELRLLLERYEVIMNQASDIIFEWDMAADYLKCSPNWKKRFGYDSKEQDFSKNILLSQNIHPNDIHILKDLLDDFARAVPYREAEFRIRDVIGSYSWCRVCATAQFSMAGVPVKVVGVIRIIDEEKKRHLRLLDQSRRDSLTGLLNKNAVRLHVQRWLEILKKKGAMFIIDLDNFKGVNDTYGHLCGDGVLSEVASRLKRQFRSDDVAGRIGGDEFLVYIPDVTEKRAVELAESLQETLCNITINNKKGMVACSIGIAFYPDHGSDFYDLYHHADEAVYYVKNHKKGGYAIYEERMEQPEMSRPAKRNIIGSLIESEADEVSIQLAQYSFRMLYSAADIYLAISQLLEIVGKAYNLSRIYIFEYTQKQPFLSNTFGWCKDGVQAPMDVLESVSFETDIKDLTGLFKEQGVFCSQNRKELPESLIRLLNGQNVSSLLACAMMDDGEFKGFVGFDECRNNQIWTREQADALILIANVLSTFLLKQRLKERL